ncbi:Rop family plasmid primer RNA-binding protein (plasmid) [Candidatus Fukatsuia symbiotica]|uniref:Rop family plasmid primer RNA-binding protein n=1 Tax=Candidatus Fukatsuia symbiotica TaxID=1878942 RepID=A0A2U8I8J4_9GAMM|nr:Rop family plasmid primer RNA-binding protein [Candidatus Fukatsuia symbiotica]AWK15502.1 hypothetical protein CCS41_13805 [Candidatus Fukatsuia symbiotica]MEA9445894.1 Rop family plasmid primer RNA-binding protein [Candidatus Fukatsuia symbiotica]
MAKKSLEQTTANMAKFLQDQSLSLLEKLDILDQDELADECQELHELAEALHQKIRKKYGPPPD